MRIDISQGWSVLQDVHDTGERLQLYDDPDVTKIGPQISEWEPISRLEHLQLLFASHPYWGRDLRYFNEAPWWYRNVVDIADDMLGKPCILKFEHVDYYAKVWMNGVLLGEHEGYSAPFEFDVSDVVKAGANCLMVKVSSPWDRNVRDDKFDNRTSQVERNLVKGTYEHSDGLIARDVNPVGIYGSVSLEVKEPSYLACGTRVSAAIAEDGSGLLTVRGCVGGRSSSLNVQISDCEGRKVASKQTTAAGEFESTLKVDDPQLWWTWDLGEPILYSVRVFLDGRKVLEKSVGFRKFDLERSDDLTRFKLNGAPLYLRGTSYFPDVYMSAMTKARYERDLMAVKLDGFNAIRVHVHVENEEFYDLCDRMGIAILQDSEYNWTQPKSEEWAERFTSIYVRTVKQLDYHPCVACWICLNEPGGADAISGTHGYAMSVRPGPSIYKAVLETDSTRPVIKGSFCADDPTSGDSHNYVGSLYGPEPYTDIDGSKEKLNTEFGFDAPGDFSNLRKLGSLSRRISKMEAIAPELRHYQLRLLKYYIEHYRCQKGKPNWGYVHFMFIDLCPQSFYGVLDWWGLPKPAFRELEMINQPVGVFLDQTKEKVTGVVAVNDGKVAFGDAEISWSLWNEEIGERIEGRKSVMLGTDGALGVEDLMVEKGEGRWDGLLTVKDSAGKVIAQNRYEDIFGHPQHPEGHPAHISHEYGVRVYSI
ncbi:hypothetical protein OZX67_08990 [Bifidobacterium sp. ESL0728]|uniref:glycoside hydrolase family 2 protein n=1 Tax=Bifidobacterium sp. ESL0728 TaxID=2983220 RepID=UPI0023F63A3D|nr:sugar-binding domain-containing protein [Bifidobacterium sp. ESL0728]WEV58905.1 hypothetical protein OZX67_08990 [Bifidobacterium sp. ESL0728]